ncbi:type IV toxin-antitoxin system AbiEi family antitoxin domain-containing protein, partial [Micromonospora sp. ATA51]|nr:type IV toxin-antitoxin system AbiEi family antitoxin domain-containing protein [Micromonospora sp. ATA51]
MTRRRTGRAGAAGRRRTLEAGLSERQLYRLRDHGLIEPVGRGLYRRHDA